MRGDSLFQMIFSLANVNLVTLFIIAGSIARNHIFTVDFLIRFSFLFEMTAVIVDEVETGISQTVDICNPGNTQ